MGPPHGIVLAERWHLEIFCLLLPAFDELVEHFQIFVGDVGTVRLDGSPKSVDRVVSRQARGCCICEWVVGKLIFLHLLLLTNKPETKWTSNYLALCTKMAFIIIISIIIITIFIIIMLIIITIIINIIAIIIIIIISFQKLTKEELSVHSTHIKTIQTIREIDGKEKSKQNNTFSFSF